MSRGERISNNPDVIDAVVRLVKAGRTDKEIAKEMMIHPDTVARARKKRGIFRKVGRKINGR